MKPVVLNFDGNKRKYFPFYKQFKTVVAYEGGLHGARLLLPHPQPLDPLVQLNNEIKAIKDTPPEQLNVFLKSDYAHLRSELQKRKNSIESESQKVKAMLESCISEAVHHNIQADYRTFLIRSQLPTENPFSLTIYPQLRATLEAFEKNYRPDITAALSHARSTFEKSVASCPNLTCIYAIINEYVNDIAKYPVLDAEGNQVHEANGDLKHHTHDEHYMKSTLCSYVRNSKDPDARAMHTQWAINPSIKFETMYEQLQAYVSNETSDLPASSSSITSLPSSTSASLPTVAAATANANAATYFDPHNVPPFRVKPNGFCKNCQRYGHYGNDCASTRCEPCQITFKSLDERLRHSRSQHVGQEDNHPRSRNSYHHGQSQHYNTDHHHPQHSSREDRYYESSHSRSRSRDRSSSSQQTRERSRTPDRRSSSSSSRPDERSRQSSPHSSRSSRSTNVSFANAADANTDGGHPFRS